MPRSIVLRRKQLGGYDRSRHPWCTSCHRQRYARERFSRVGYCDDCSALRTFAAIFGTKSKLHVIDGIFEYWVFTDERWNLFIQAMGDRSGQIVTTASIRQVEE